MFQNNGDIIIFSHEKYECLISLVSDYFLLIPFLTWLYSEFFFKRNIAFNIDVM